MDKTQKKLIIAVMLVICTMAVIMYSIYIIDKNSVYQDSFEVEEGTGNINQDKPNENIDAEKEKEIIEEINVTSELVVNHLNREELYDKATHVLYGKILDKKDALYTKDLKYPFTSASFEVASVIKGELPTIDVTNIDSKENKIVNLSIPGGEVTLSEYIRANILKNPEEIAKKGYDKLSEKEKEGKYIKVNYEYSNNFEKDEWYIIFVIATDKNEFVVPTYTCMIKVDEGMTNITKESIMNMPEVEKK